MRNLHLATGLLALTLACTACGDHGSADSSAASGSPGDGDYGDYDPGYDPGGGSGGGDGGGGHVPPGPGGDASAGGFGWVPFGPADPTSPTPDWSAYRALALHHCDIGTPESDQSDGHLWRALDALCAAAVQGEASQWDVARTEFAAAGDRYFIYSGCLDSQARALLSRGLAWHDAHPGGKPEVEFPQESGSTGCAQQFSAENGIPDSADTSTEEPSPAESSPQATTDTTTESSSETATETP